MLALGKDGTPGDNSNLKALAKIAEANFDFNSLGVDVTMGDAFASKIGTLGSASRQASISAKPISHCKGTRKLNGQAPVASTQMKKGRICSCISKHIKPTLRLYRRQINYFKPYSTPFKDA